MQSDLLAMAVLQEPKTEMSRESLYLSDAMITSSLYGARLYRPDHGVIIHTNAVLPLT
jgi:hypothetical protein